MVGATDEEGGLDGIDVGAIDQQVLRLFAMVSEGLTGATEAFLQADRTSARRLLASEQLVDDLHQSTEELVQHELERTLKWADADVRQLVSALRIVPELERSGDLVEHIALRTLQGLAREISPRARALIADMGRIGAQMWEDAADAYADRDPTAADRLRQRDDELDDLHVQLTQELASSPSSGAVAIEMALIARFYERLGDHAVNVARRVQQIVRSVEPAAPV
jgi:phosphate transport system protein